MAICRLPFKIALSCVVILLSASLPETVHAQAQTISINGERIQIAKLIEQVGGHDRELLGQVFANHILVFALLKGPRSRGHITVGVVADG